MFGPRSLLAAATSVVLAGAGTAVLTLAASAPAEAALGTLDNGLARTPQMGFNNWNSTHCRADFNEDMVKGIADLFVSAGLKDAGYEYVNLDDCWALPQRDEQGDLVPDPVRFPHGIKAVADYVHGKGLKFGIYSSAGTKTCDRAGFPGGLGHEQQDADLWASWGVDYLKYDNCNNQGVDAVQRYTVMRDALKATGRPILYSICEWGQNKPWLWAKDVGNSWRTTGDINDTYTRMLSIIRQNMVLAPYAGPGHWNDPDMLEVGNGGMTETEYRTHFSLWSVMAAPLLIGTDLRKATPETVRILLNRDVIAIDQDRLGVQGAPIKTDGGRDVFVKPLAGGDRAVALFNETDRPQRISTSAREAGLPAAKGYRIRDLWTHTDRHTAGTISATVPPHGTVLYRVGTDRHWHAYPPALDLGLGVKAPYPTGPAIAQPGKPAEVTTTATNLGALPALRPRVTVRAPDGWTVRATAPDRAAVLAKNATLTTTWRVGVPDGVRPGRYDLTATVSYRGGAGLRVVTGELTIPVVVPPPPPAGVRYVSDIPWMSAVNGFGPVEKDTSNGESKTGDGHPITINGVGYAKGLGAHAPGEIVYYTGGSCSAFSAEVGVDDEKTANGSVTFEVWTDGDKVADSGPLTVADPARHLTAGIGGAALVRLIVTDGGNGNNSDHADWADAKLSCL